MGLHWRRVAFKDHVSVIKTTQVFGLILYLTQWCGHNAHLQLDWFGWTSDFWFLLNRAEFRACQALWQKPKSNIMRIIVRSFSKLLSWLKLNTHVGTQTTVMISNLSSTFYTNILLNTKLCMWHFGIVSEMLYSPNPSCLPIYMCHQSVCVTYLYVPHMCMCHLEVMAWYSSLKDQPWLLSSKFYLWAERRHTLPTG